MITTLSFGLQSKIENYKKYINAFKSQLGRTPSDNELCVYLGVSDKTLDSIKAALHQYDTIKSLDDEIPGTGDESLTLGDAIADKANLENDFIDDLMEQKIKTELWKIVEDNITDKENEAIIYRYKKNMTLRDAAKEMNISFERVRQLEQKGLRKLRVSRITRDIQERFEVNFTRAYRGSASSFKYDWTSCIIWTGMDLLFLQWDILAKRQ